jgi:hypothetical protein
MAAAAGSGSLGSGGVNLSPVISVVIYPLDAAVAAIGWDRRNCHSTPR